MGALIKPTFNLINIHMRIARHRRRDTIATTIHLTDAGKRFDIQRRASLTMSIIGCLVATTIQLTDDNRTTARLFNIHGDLSTDCSANVVTAKHAVEITVGDIQRHIA